MLQAGQNGGNGAEGDSCEAETTHDCETSDEEVNPRDPGSIAVGLMTLAASAPPALYMTGSDGNGTCSISPTVD